MGHCPAGLAELFERFSVFTHFQSNFWASPRAAAWFFCYPAITIIIVVVTIIIVIMITALFYCDEWNTNAFTSIIRQDVFLLGTFAKLRRAATIFVTSVSPSAWNTWIPTGRIFMIFIFEYFFKKKNIRGNSNVIKFWLEWCVLYMKTYVHLTL
jgi:hypothetical protein